MSVSLHLIFHLLNLNIGWVNQPGMYTVTEVDSALYFFTCDSIYAIDG